MIISLLERKKIHHASNLVSLLCHRQTDIRVNASFSGITSPVIFARTHSILKMVESIGIPQYDLSPCYLCYQFDCRMTIPTNSEVLHYSNRHWCRNLQKSICDSEFLTMMSQASLSYVYKLFSIHPSNNLVSADVSSFF